MAGSLEVNVVTYNVLSGKLATPEHYVETDSRYLSSESRLQRLKRRLFQRAVKSKAVVCLQEVSQAWQGALETFFCANEYTFVFSGYGNSRNGYMGVGVAFPNAKFTLEDANVVRLADTGGRWPSRARRPPPTLGRRLWNTLSYIPFGVGDWLLGRYAPENVLDVEYEIGRRRNAAVSVALTTEANAEFTVTTYHCPCMFGTPEKREVQLVHTAMLLQHAKKWAGSRPFIVAGDFNTQPDSACYRMMALGENPATSPDMPVPLAKERAWILADLPKMRSAYREHKAAEPMFTTNVVTRFDPEGFKGTLDYILLSPDISVRGTELIPEDSMLLPNEAEPSDHYLLGATLLLGEEAGSSDTEAVLVS